MSIFRDSLAGTLIRFVSSNRLLRYPEEEPNFVLPTNYLQNKTSVSPIESENDGQLSTPDPETAGGMRPESNNAASKGTVLVTWYSDSDPANPQNWSSAKKAWIAGLLFAYTFAAYIGSSVYAASIPGIRQEFHTSEAVASLGMTLYVFAYGLGPLLFSPLAEIPAIGRNPPYIITFCIFTVLTIAVPIAKSMAGILVVRFLLGFFCSPALATVGASYGDMFHAARMQFVIALWGGGATLAPVSISPGVLSCSGGKKAFLTHLLSTVSWATPYRICCRSKGMAMERVGAALALLCRRSFNDFYSTRNLERCHSPLKSTKTTKNNRQRKFGICIRTWTEKHHTWCHCFWCAHQAVAD